MCRLQPCLDKDHPVGHVVPLLCLLGVVVLLSSITPLMKHVFQQNGVTVLDVACGRVEIGFIFLAGITACLDWRGLTSFNIKDIFRLGTVGIIGVGSYIIAAWGLMNTSVTHYALIYSLLPTFTALLSLWFGTAHRNPSLWFGVFLSWMGCIMALSDDGGLQLAGFGFGDALVLLFTFMMSAHIVFSAHVVKRHGVLASNTAMFGITALLLAAGQTFWGASPEQNSYSWNVVGSVLLIGVGTAGVFLLRYRSLRSLSPTTVGAYHNLTPICTIGIAHFSLGEPVTMQTIVGSIAVIIGTEWIRRAPYSLSLAWSFWNSGKRGTL